MHPVREDVGDLMIVYVSIGNSDDELSQREWSNFCLAVNEAVFDQAPAVHGRWFSDPSSPWQNSCWCIELDEGDARVLKPLLAKLAGKYRQDSIAWAEAPVTEFIGGVA